MLIIQISVLNVVLLIISSYTTTNVSKIVQMDGLKIHQRIDATNVLTIAKLVNLLIPLARLASLIKPMPSFIKLIAIKLVQLISVFHFQIFNAQTAIQAAKRA